MLDKEPPCPSPEAPHARDGHEGLSPYLVNSYVSPKSGLNGLPVLSHWEATAETAKAATDWKQPQAGEGRLSIRCGSRGGEGAPLARSRVPFQSPTCNTFETAELPGKCCLSPATSSQPRKVGTLPPSTPSPGLPRRPCPSHTRAHTRAYTRAHTHTLTWGDGAERGQEEPSAGATTRCSPAAPTTRQPRPRLHGMCPRQMPWPWGRTAPQHPCKLHWPFSQVSHC